MVVCSKVVFWRKNYLEGIPNDIMHRRAYDKSCLVTNPKHETYKHIPSIQPVANDTTFHGKLSSAIRHEALFGKESYHENHTITNLPYVDSIYEIRGDIAHG